VVGAQEGSRKEEVSVCGTLDGLMHTDTKVKLVECTPAEREKLGWVTGAAGVL
jgi:hypothetical protein